MRPQPNEYAHYYGRYVALAPGENIMQAFDIAEQLTTQYLDKIPAEKGDYRYAEGKWTIKQLLQHVIDSERIFAYRALCIARGDQTSFPSFDENLYAVNGTGANRTLADMNQEFKLVRTTTKILFQSFTNDDLHRVGTANNAQVSVLAVGFITIGHSIHHVNVLKERYLVQAIA